VVAELPARGDAADVQRAVFAGPDHDRVTAVADADVDVRGRPGPDDPRLLLRAARGERRKPERRLVVGPRDRGRAARRDRERRRVDRSAQLQRRPGRAVGRDAGQARRRLGGRSVDREPGDRRDAGRVGADVGERRGATADGPSSAPGARVAG